MFTEREQRNIRADFEGTLAQIRSLIQNEIKLAEMYLHSKIFEEQEAGLGVVQKRIDIEVRRKCGLFKEYLNLIALERERALD